jgi:hypothetical protein
MAGACRFGPAGRLGITPAFGGVLGGFMADFGRGVRVPPVTAFFGRGVRVPVTGTSTCAFGVVARLRRRFGAR